MEICIKQDENILTKFLIYRDLRTKGYVVKDGLDLVLISEFMNVAHLVKKALGI